MLAQVVHMLCLALLAFMSATSAFAGAAESSFHLAIVSDRTGGHTEGVYPRVLDEVALLAPDIVVTVGDQIEGYADDMERAHAEWDTLLAFLDVLDCPVYLTPGNHDIWSDESEAVYIERTGRRPYYSFDYENTHFVILDNSRFDDANAFPDDQKAWLVEDLDANRDAENIYVFFHKPLWMGTLQVGEPDPLHGIFLEHGVDAVFCGHLHHYFSTNYDGIDYTVMGSSGGGMSRANESIARGEFFQFGWAHVDGGDYDMAVVHLGEMYPADVVTVERLEFIERIEGELISVRAMRVPEGQPVAGGTMVTIRNEMEQAIGGKLSWDVPENWDVTPPLTTLDIAPGATEQLEFSVSNTGDLFPVPSLSFDYPLDVEAQLDVDVPLRVLRSRTATRMKADPRIDGAPKEKCWAKVEPTTDLYAAYEGYDLEGDTEFYFGWDGGDLFIAAKCHDDQMDALVASTDERDGAVYREDCVGFFFQPDPQEMTVYQIYFSALGTVFDQKITFDETMYYDADLSWDGKYDVATRREDDHWSIEARIALAPMGADIEKNPVWGANFRRKQARTNSAVDWQVPIDYDPRTYGEMRFE